MDTPQTLNPQAIMPSELFNSSPTKTQPWRTPCGSIPQQQQQQKGCSNLSGKLITTHGTTEGELLLAASNPA
jgi:hypothetical protein